MILHLSYVLVYFSQLSKLFKKSTALTAQTSLCFSVFPLYTCATTTFNDSN